MLLLQSPLKAEISQESLSYQNYWLNIIQNFLSMYLFLSVLTYF